MSDSAHEEHPSLEELDLLVDDGADGDGTHPGLAAHAAGCPQCAEAVADLSGVRALLRAEAATVPPRPADLDERIDAALARAAREADGSRSTSGAAATVVPIRTRSRVPRWAAAAAGLVVLGGAALTAAQLLGDRDGPVAGVAQESARSEDESGMAGAAGAQANPPVLATGTEYEPETLDQQVRDLLVARGSFGSGASPESGTGGGEAVDGDERLTDPSALRACLEALGTDPSAAAAVDLATWQGREVAVIVLQEGPRRAVWVVDRGCRPGADGLVHYQVLPD